MDEPHDSRRRCLDPALRTTETICAWCGMTLSGAVPPLPDGRENYGMCRRCLSHRLWRLEHPREEAVALRAGSDPAAPPERQPLHRADAA
jgi:hypothetical protein